MSGFLAQVCAEARDRVAAAVGDRSLADVRAAAADAPRPPSLLSALGAPGTVIVTEVKRASPSRGPLAAIPDPAELARSYVTGGAAAVSVLTEPAHFRGSLEDLRAVAAAVEVPVLRKDFVVDEYQVWEARAAGAAAVLLIVVAVEQDDLVALLDAVARAGLDALLEVHTELEITRAVGAHEAAGITTRPLLGVNARDLTTLAVDPDRFAVLRPVAPDDAVLVAESGVHGPDDVRRLTRLGADAVLVGEAVATAEDTAAAVAALVAAGRETAAR